MANRLLNFKGAAHYVLWFFMFFLVFDYHFFETNIGEALLYTSMEILTYMVVFYFNYKIAIPYFLNKGKKWLYGISILSFLVFYILVVKISGLEFYFYENGFWRNILSIVINFGMFWLVSFLLWFSLKWQEERELQLQMKAEKLEVEMKFLKNQISPHFIFNTLNNIYSLVQQKHDNAAPMLAKLSKILRYLLYDSSQKEVFLKKELDAIQHYIELQLLRKPKSQNVDFYKEGRVAQLKVVPLLLLNFVENAFKHGNLDKTEEAWIQISCTIDENSRLHFIIENSKTKTIGKRLEGGLGNQNIERQLALNYPNKHELEIENAEDIYKLNLTIDLT